MTAPIIGITPDIANGKLSVSPRYTDAVVVHGGVPIVLSCHLALIPAYLAVCDAFLFTGGDDPDMTPFGLPTHPCTTVVDSARQVFELALFRALDDQPDYPVLGICLGMQLMGLHAGAALNQHLPDSLPTAADHADGQFHLIDGPLGRGSVHSRHHQALLSPGSLHVVARGHDGVIEAVSDPSRAFYLGVQWHPERTADDALGSQLFAQLVRAAAAHRRARSSCRDSRAPSPAT